jgi:hypothetical protein
MPIREETMADKSFPPGGGGTTVITCPACKRKYHAKTVDLKDVCQKMRCSQCGHVFVYERRKLEDMDFIDRIGSIPPLQKGAHQIRRRPRRLALTIVLLFILLVVSGGGYVYWQDYLGAGDQYLRIKRLEGQELVIKDGNIFLVTGVIANESTKPRSGVILKTKLFDKDNKLLGVHLNPAGFALPKEQAEKMGRVDLEKIRIPNEHLVLRQNKEIPFTVIFFDAEFGKIKEFSVEVDRAPL